MKISMKNVETGLRPVSTLVLLILLVTSCSRNHLINDDKYRGITENAFKLRKALAAERDSALFSVFNSNLSQKQTEALEFLYAYMPLSDLADYNGSFFLANIDVSLRTQSETSWGKDIPEDIFLHYVLPCRINNENLDSFRIDYYDELMNRVKGKKIDEAALEINHWCHEKVSYLPSDIRTSGPLSTILSARGRCGEESTFTVAALRTVGIPARQVYTPRWAHSDDNHAWVEIWINGNWYYMGACEPEPLLDRGWFTEPARRAMLVHTKSFGAPLGNENIINKYPDHSEVNNLSKYAVTKKILVKVTDSDNHPVYNAQVEFQLYNYAEFYPLAIVATNQDGISEFETGLGDLLIWAHKDDNFAFRKISVGETDSLILKLNGQTGAEKSLDLDLDVPVVRYPLPGPKQELVEENSVKIKKENLIRQKYIDSWMTPEQARRFASSLKIDTGKAMDIIARSMGNYNEITSFLSETSDSLRSYALSLLAVLQDKDLRDIKRSTLSDHLNYSLKYVKTSGDFSGNRIFSDYILNPRIANELLVPWRRYFVTKLPQKLVLIAQGDPGIIVQYLNDKIRITDGENYYRTPLTPIGVNELKVSDAGSRAICFVAICRSLGIPSRLESGSNIPQYYFHNTWIDVYFSDQKQPDRNKGYIMLKSADVNPVPEYYIHFTLARFEKGRYNTLEYDYNKKITDFKEELPLPPGHYMLVTGNRLSDGKILSGLLFFDLKENEHRTLDVKIRKDISEKKILGKIDIGKFKSLIEGGTSQSCNNDKGFVMIWIEPEKEPTKHIFNDLPILKNELDAWGGKFLFLSETPGDSNSLFPGRSIGLPANTSFGADNQLNLLKNSVKLTDKPEMNMPVVIGADSNGNILFISTGYRIGIGEQILKYVR
jgi:transglutaminase-like putative cysteine protease